MTTSNITPDGSSGTGAHVTVTGAASAHAALADASDASYVEYNGAGPTSFDTLIVDFTTFTIPTGAIVLSATNNYRAAVISGVVFGGAGVNVYRINATSYAPQGTAVSATDYTNSYTSTAAGLPSAQADVDGYQMGIGVSSASAVWRVYTASVDITYALVPTATATAPSGSVTTTLSPTVTWTHTPGSDAPGGQTKYQVKIFTAAQYGAGGFDPETSTAAFTTGTVSSAATSAASCGPLANSTTFRAYVKTAQTTLGTDQWSAWSYSGFSTSVTTSDITSVVATADNTNGRHAVVVTRTASTPTWTLLEVQSSYDGGTTWEYVRGYTAYDIPGATVTGVAATDLFTLTAHGLSAGNTVVFSDLTGGAGITAGTTYFVIASGLTANAFRVSTSSGGSTINFTTDLTAGTMQSALTVSLYDYEAPNGTACTYRARATYTAGGVITSAWTTSSTATWTMSTTVWLKDITTPSLNQAVRVRGNPEPTYERTVGVFRPLGASYPVAVADARQVGTSTITVQTQTAAEETALRALLAGNGPMLLQFPATTGWGWGTRYVVAIAVREFRLDPKVIGAYRHWEIDLVEIARPADTGIA